MMQEEIERARKIIKDIIHGLLIEQPFFGIWLSRTWIYADSNEESISTDGIRIFVNPKIFDRDFDAEKFIMGLLHVLGHIIFKHVPRGARKVNTEQDAIIWHFASDAVLNREMFNDLTLIEEISKKTGVSISELKKMRVEEIFDLLKQNNVSIESIGQGQGQDHMRFGQNANAGQGQPLIQPQQSPQSQSSQSQQGNNQQGQGQQQNQGNQSQHGGGQGQQGQKSQQGSQGQGNNQGNNQNGGMNQQGQGGSCNRQGSNPQQGPGQQGQGGGGSQSSGQGNQQSSQGNQPQSQQGGGFGQGQGNLVPLNEGDKDESIDADIDASEMEKKIDSKNLDIMGSLKYIGKLPAWAQRMFEELAKPKIDWRDILRAVLDRAIGREIIKKWNLLNRHFPEEKPGKEFYGIDRIGVLIDTSGSISDTELRQFVSEVYAILSARGVSSVYVIPWDATAYPPVKLTSPGQINKLKTKIMGGGGTMIKPALELAKKLKLDFIIILSDWDIGDIGNTETQKLLSSFKHIIAITTHTEPVVPKHAIKLRLPIKP